MLLAAFILCYDLAASRRWPAIAILAAATTTIGVTKLRERRCERRERGEEERTEDEENHTLVQKVWKNVTR